MQENKSTSARPKETFYQAQHVSRHRSLIRYPAVPNPKISNDDTALRNSGANRGANQSSLANLLVDDIWIQRLATLSDPPISAMMCPYPVFRDAVRRTTVREKEVDCEGEGEVQMVVKIKVCMDILARSAIHSLYLRRSVRLGECTTLLPTNRNSGLGPRMFSRMVAVIWFDQMSWKRYSSVKGGF
jgi:hypothetical protein